MKPRRRSLASTIILILLLFLLVGSFLTYQVIHRLTNTKIFEPVDAATETFTLPSDPFNLCNAIAEGKAFSMEYPMDGFFTVLWGTDFHLRRGPFAGRKNVYALLDKAFEELDPDLTIIGGDLLFSFDGIKILKEFATFMQERGRLWAYEFGNHDGEYTYDRPTLGSSLKDFSAALFSTGEEWVRGYSDYPIVLTDQRTPVQALMLLDSHDSRIYDGNVIAPDYVYPSQIAWYRWVEDGLGTVPLYTFLHIPLPEFKLLWESGTATGVKLDKKINTPLENSGLFAAMQEKHNTVAVFSGHDHLNDFFGTWEGIDLHYGRSASYGSYGSKDHAKGIKAITFSLHDPSYTVTTYTVDDWNL